MLDLRLVPGPGSPAVLAVGVPAADDGHAESLDLLAEPDRDGAAAFLADVEHSGAAGTVHSLPRPAHRTRRLIFVGTGDGDEAGWRAAGAALARAARGEPSLSVTLPAGVPAHAVRGLAEGLWLASYRYRVGSDDADKAPKLRRVNVVVDEPSVYEPALAAARAVAEGTVLARDLTNASSDRKTPDWLARQVERAASGGRPTAVGRLSVTVLKPRALAEEGFGAILAVGRGSANPPRFVELSWRPRGATRHVVLIGKGITFDTGGICIKPREMMKLMRKDMGGAAAVVGATVAAAALSLPVRITTLTPLAENAVGPDAYRPGDVIRHYGGVTTEVTNTDAEGRLVLADALAYAAKRLHADYVVDLATLTGAQGIALGKRTAALFSYDDGLAGALAAAADAAGEQVWRMPLDPAYVDDYADALRSDVADLVNSAYVGGGAGAVVAALFLREFVGAARDRWAHVDMSSSAWADSNEGELVKGATGWGVRTLVRWLESLT